jgi:hypothetical protein
MFVYVILDASLSPKFIGSTIQLPNLSCMVQLSNDAAGDDPQRYRDFTLMDLLVPGVEVIGRGKFIFWAISDMNQSVDFPRATNACLVGPTTSFTSS